VNATTTPAEMLAELMKVNAEAMRESRRGEVGIRSQRYAAEHEEINDLLTRLLGH
jgi:hypothetical protein